MSSRATEGNPKVLFFERSPFISVELLDLLNDYQIVCYNDDSTYKLLKRDWNLSSYLNTEFTKELENDKAIEILLNDNRFLDMSIRDKERSKALFSYMNPRINELLKDSGIPMLLPPYKVQEKLGNKLHLPNICKKLNIISNESLIFQNPLEDVSEMYMKCQNSIGSPFVVQGSSGVSGEDTFLISTEKEFRRIIRNLFNGFKATKYIENNISVSVQVCVLDGRVIIRGPFLQLIGFSELTTKPFQFAGNDTNQSLFDQNFVEKVQNISLRIGEYARSEGYKGILGIDYLWDRDANFIYPQELNTRLVGLTRLLTGIQKDQSVFPDLLTHIAAFTTPSFSERCKYLNSNDIGFSQHNYSQIIIYNNLPHNVIVSNNIDPSIYQVINGTLQKSKPSLFVHDMEKGEVLISNAAHEGRELYPGGMIARIILKQSAIQDHQYKLNSKVIELVDLIRKHIIGTYV